MSIYVMIRHDYVVRIYLVVPIQVDIQCNVNSVVNPLLKWLDTASIQKRTFLKRRSIIMCEMCVNA